MSKFIGNFHGDMPIRYIKGVGPKKADIFKKAGIDNLSDLFHYLPKRYEDRRNIVKVKDLKHGENQAVMGEVMKTSVFTVRTGTRIFEAAVGDTDEKLHAVWYNQPFMKNMLKKGDIAVFYGKCEYQGTFRMSHPAFEVLGQKGKENFSAEKLKNSPDLGRIVPVYSLTENLTQRYMRKIMHRAVYSHSYIKELEDILPTRIRAKRRLVDTAFAVENIHYPHSADNLKRAYRRLVFEEFFILQMIMALRRAKISSCGIKHGTESDLKSEFEKLFDFHLTDGQKKCIGEIERDMASPRPMRRLLEGDVGSGKTVVAMYALLMASRGAYQSAVMVPTEILARQHFVTLSKIFMPMGINVRLLIGALETTAKEKIKKEMISGEADIIVGTHALFQEDVVFSNLGLVIIDEQHKFGVLQGKKLFGKGRAPDLLVMTATPIPRSLALTLYGDMDISLLRDKPYPEQSVFTYWAEDQTRDDVYKFVSSEIKKGHQAFIVYPRISKKNSSGLKSATEMYEYLKSKVFRYFRLGLIHGKMKYQDKYEIMQSFRDGKYDILIATTVIEVGIDIPNATVMLVEHAERYGLAQLHQLRGRISRGKDASYCILLGDAKESAAYERLTTMAETEDGFKISEKDLELRGPGEFLGTRQSGLPEIKVGDISRDFGIMEEAREEAFSLVKEDPVLNDARNQGIKRSIIRKIGQYAKNN